MTIDKTYCTGRIVTVHVCDDCPQKSRTTCEQWSKIKNLLKSPFRPCPHPEWCGVWDYCGDGYRITWDGLQYRSQLIGGGNNYLPPDWEGPGEFWRMVEPAPLASRAHPPFKKPGVLGKAHRDYIKTPWNP